MPPGLRLAAPPRHVHDARGQVHDAYGSVGRRYSGHTGLLEAAGDWHMTTVDEPKTTSERRVRPSGREAKRAARAARAAASVPYITRSLPHYEVLGEEGLNSSSATPTRSSKRSASFSAMTPRRCRSGSRPAPTSTANACVFRAACAARSCSATRPASSSSTHATRRAASASAAMQRCSRRRTARRSSTTSTKAGATPASRTSAIS